MARTYRLAVVAALLLAACGGDDDEANRPPTERTTSSTSAPAPRTASFEASLVVEGSFPNGAVHTVRVEDADDGKQMFERTLAASGTTSEDLAPGDYRVLAFYRQCRTAGCGPKTPVAELGEPEGICGSVFTVEADKPTRAAITVVPDEACTVVLS